MSFEAAKEAHENVSTEARRKVLQSVWDNLLRVPPLREDSAVRVMTWHDLNKIERELFIHYCEQGLIQSGNDQGLVADAQYDHDQLNSLADEAVQADAGPIEVPDYNCSGCGRHELECSENPCDDVVRDREEEYSQGELF